MKRLVVGFAVLLTGWVLTVSWVYGGAGRNAGAKGELGVLRQRLYSADALDRLYAAATLLERGTPPALTVLREVLSSANDRQARLSVLEALRRRLDARFIEDLISLLGDEDAEVRRRAAEVLGAFRDHGVVDRLARLARDPSASETTLLGLVEALVATRRTEAVGVLINLLRSRYKGVRAAALEALRGITPEDFGEDYRAWLLWWRLNRHKTQLQWNRDLLPKLQRRVQELKTRLERARRDAIRWALAFEGTITDPKERAEFLRKLLRSDYPELRAHAAQELPRIPGAEGTLEALLEALADRDLRVVAAAAEGLGNLGDPKATDQLRALLAHEAPEVRKAAATALGRLHATGALDQLLARLRDVDPGVRAAAARACGEIQDSGSLPRLLASLKDPDPAVRESAVGAVARFKDPRVVPALIEVLLTDRTAPRARFAAARFLADFPGREVDDALVKGLADPDPGVRRAAAASLGKRAAPDLVNPLIARALSDEDRTVREEAWSSAMALLRGQGNLRLLDGVSARLLEGGQADKAAEVLTLLDGLAGKVGAEERNLLQALYHRRAEALFKAGDWARAAADYRRLLAAGDTTVRGKLAEALERAGSFRSAAEVYLEDLPPSGAAERAQRLNAVLTLARRALEADRPRQAILILQDLRRAVPGTLPGGQEEMVRGLAERANKRLLELADKSTSRVRVLLVQAAGKGEVAEKAFADLQALGFRAVPTLISALSDEREEVRRAAVRVLRSIAGVEQGFDPAGAEADRRAAQARWRAWFDRARFVPGPLVPAP